MVLYSNRATTSFVSVVSPGTGSLAITFDDTGNLGNALDFLVLKSTTPVSIASNGVVGGDNALGQLEDTNNSLTKVTISGSEEFLLGGFTNNSNTGDGAVTDIVATAKSPKTIHSSLTLIDASATTGFADIFAGATNTSGSGPFLDGGKLNANVTITYTGLKIKGGSGNDIIENDAKNGIVTAGNSNGDDITLQDKKYDKGLSMYAGVELEYDLAGKYKDFKALLGVDSSIAEEGQGKVTVTNYCDREKRGTFEVSTKAPTPISTNVKGVTTLRIVVSGSNFTNYSGHATLANAQVSQ